MLETGLCPPEEESRTLKRLAVVGLSALVLSVTPALLHAQRVVSEMTPALIAEAITAGEKGRASDGVMEKGSLSGWTTLAVFSTPFMRVAAAAQQAKKEYKRFTPDDVTPEMIAPELHIYAFAQAVDASSANVTTVVITPRKGSHEEKAAQALHPTRFEPMPMLFQNLFGARFKGEGRLAVFPLSALSGANEVHVVYDQKVKIGVGSFASYCDDCAVWFRLTKVR